MPKGIQQKWELSENQGQQQERCLDSHNISSLDSATFMSSHISRRLKLLLLSLYVKAEVTLCSRKYFGIYLRAEIVISPCLLTGQYVLNDWGARSSREVTNVVTRLFMFTAISDVFSESQQQTVVLNKNDTI